MSDLSIIRRGGGGASLNYKIISGSKPSGGGGDTLTWDGNTEGLESVLLSNGFEFFRISDAVPTRADCENGVTVVRSDGSTETLTNCFDVKDLGIFGFIISVPKDNFEWEGGIFPKAGCWAFSMGGLYVSSLTIPNYTGFGGGASVKENTIWVNTETKITSHAFSATEPENPVEGMVWFKTGTSGSVVFNALKKNTIEVCVTGCQQYVSGAWAPKTSQAYIEGKWRDFYVFLYNKGDFCESVTGGWESKSGKISLDTAKAPTITKNEDSVTISITGYGEGYYRPINKIDLTNVSKLVWDADVTVSYKVRLRVFASSLTTEAAELSYSSSTNKTIHELDVSSLTGEYYVAVCIATGNSGKSTVTMRSLRME